MSVVRRGNSRFLYIQFQFNGRTYIKSSRTQDRKVAERMENEWRSKLHSNQVLGERETITLDKALQLYSSSKKGTPNHRNILSSIKSVSAALSHRRHLSDVKSEDLERFKQERLAAGFSEQTIKHQLGMLLRATKHARRLGYRVPDIEFPVIRLPKHRLRWLSIAEEARLLDELSPMRESRGLKPYADRSDELRRCMHDAYDLVVLLLDTGARYSEIANIRWLQIDLENGEIRLWRPKVQNESIILMSRRVTEVLGRRSAQPHGEYVFENKLGGPRGYAAIAIKKAMKRAGLSDCRVHTLRHTLASRLVQNGMTVYEVKSILGHTDLRTTMRYAHLEERQAATNARRILDRLGGLPDQHSTP